MQHVRARANRYNYAVAFFVALGSFTYGFNSAIIGSVIGLPSFYSYFKFELTSSYGGSIVGASNGLYAGAGCLGCWSVFWLLDLWGRKRAVQIIAVACIVSAAIQTGSVHIAMFLVGRFLNGLGVGWINCAIPTYISEISPAAQRGRIVGSHGFIICFAYVCPPVTYSITVQKYSTYYISRECLDGVVTPPTSKRTQRFNGGFF